MSRVTTRARCWRVVRRDGAAFGFTDHDRDLAFGGTLFRADTGLGAGAVERSTGLSVDNGAAVGALSDAGITEGDIAAGRWDGAEVTAWEVDWTDTGRREVTFRGSFGEIVRADGAFRVELRGLAEALNRPLGRVYARDWHPEPGDIRGDLIDAGLAVEVALEGVADGVLTWPSFPAFEAGWFERGRVVVLSGTGAGLEAQVRRDVEAGAGRRLELWGDLAAARGDVARIEAGFDGRAETWLARFGDLVEFRGFPHIPGEDWLTAYPVSGGRNDGGPLR